MTLPEIVLRLIKNLFIYFSLKKYFIHYEINVYAFIILCFEGEQGFVQAEQKFKYIKKTIVKTLKSLQIIVKR